MNNLLTILLFIAATTQFVFSQNEFPLLDSTDVPDAVITRSERYDGNTLWGYINGGADIYLEYGFEAVQVQEISWNKQRFKIDIFRMNDNEAAFGIFSVSQRRCTITDKLTLHRCITAHQIQIAEGNFYISIINANGTDEQQRFSSSLADKILKKIKHRDGIIYPTLLQNKLFLDHLNKLLFVKGPLGLQNGFPEWIDLFDGVMLNSIYMLPLRMDKGDFIVSVIHFTTEKDLLEFCNRITVGRDGNKKETGIKKLSPTEMIYYETTLKPEDVKRFKLLF